MKRMQRIAFQATIICLVLLVLPSAAQAIPPLPSSFYGTVKVNNKNVADGTLVEALINDIVVAHGYTQTYQGDSVYTLDIPGDDGSTTAIEGGKEGFQVSFNVEGVTANETGYWHTGTNVMLNLTVDSLTALNTPQPTPTHIATQTPISLVYATDLPTRTSTVVVNNDQTQTSPQQTLSNATVQITAIISSTQSVPNGSIPTSVSTTGTRVVPGNDGPNLTLVMILMAALLLAIVLLVIEIIRQRNKPE